MSARRFYSPAARLLGGSQIKAQKSSLKIDILLTILFKQSAGELLDFEAPSCLPQGQREMCNSRLFIRAFDFGFLIITTILQQFDDFSLVNVRIPEACEWDFHASPMRCSFLRPYLEQTSPHITI